MRKTGESYTAARQFLLRSLVREGGGFEVQVSWPDGRPAQGARVGACKHADMIDEHLRELLSPRGPGKYCHLVALTDDTGLARFPGLDATFAGFFVARHDGSSGRSSPVRPVGSYPIVLDEPVERGQLRLRFEGAAWPPGPDAWLEFEVRTQAGDTEERRLRHPEGGLWPAWFGVFSDQGCELDDLPLGPVEVSLVRFDGHHVQAAVSAVVRREQVEEVSLRLGTRADLHGLVVWPDGEPISTGRIRHASLKPDGRFTLLGLPSALPVRLELESVPGLARLVLVSDLVIDALEGAELTLQVAVGRELRVVDESGSPVAGVEVSGMGVMGKTDHEGVLRLPPEPGPQRLWLSAEGYRQTSVDASDAAQRVTLLPAREPAVIALRVRNAEGEGLPARVDFESDLSPGSRESGSEQCAPDGSVTWSVPAGRTDLEVHLAGYRPATHPVRPEPGQRVDVELVLEPEPSRERVPVRGVVRGALPGPLFRYQVWASPQGGGKGHSSRIRDGGCFELGLLPVGAYELRVYQQGKPFGEAVAVDVQAMQSPLSLELRVEPSPSDP